MPSIRQLAVAAIKNIQYLAFDTDASHIAKNL
jgi:hypothetical protein